MNARRFVLDMFAAAPPRGLKLSQLLRGAEVLKVKPTAVRVALTRLVTEGTLERAGRGMYRRMRSKDDVSLLIARWRERDEQVKRWNGSLLGVSGLIEAAAVPRMLRWAGLRPLWHGVSMWVRPANLHGGIDVVKDAVARALGGRVTGQSWSVFELHGCDAQDIDRCRQSFLEDFDDRYARRTRELARMRLKVAKLPMEQAAATSFKVGSAAITEVLSDPLLPASWIDGHARRAWFAEVRRFDAVGRRIWGRLLELETAVASRGPVALTRIAEEAAR